MASPHQEPAPVEEPAGAAQPDWSLPLGFGGAVAGAALGVLAFWGLYANGIYAIMLPGVLAGLGGGYPLKSRSLTVGLFAALLSGITMLLTEWWFRPFVKDESLQFFLAHLHHLNRAAILMVVLGVAAAFWFGIGRDKRS
jgi:hypothetical protein